VESLGKVDAHRLYLLGFSLGGDVALKLAAELPDVQAVVAVSPFVGPTDFVAALSTYASSASLGGQRIVSDWGSNIHSRAYRRQDPDIAAITAPVLLLQGQQDYSVPWQSVQLFYQQMKAAKKAVVLHLYPNGGHGLKGVPAAWVALEQWFVDHGAPHVATGAGVG
jgi:dipeptidyl aminopeptidase/acylaminoacyl peptidase